MFTKSRRADEPFVAVNCGAIPNDLIESQLFGYERGAFTSTQASHHGYVERARNGILFLDEVGELPMLMQVKLLRLIQERAFTRVGGRDRIKSGARIICATNTDLEAAVAEGCSRRDLYYRINVIPVVIPPLRDRSDDILPLTQSFIRELSRAFHRDIKGFTAEAEQLLLQHSWPGNVRELRNRVERRWQCQRRSRSMRRHFFHPRRGLGAAIPALGLPWPNASYARQA